jgi:hypothetical protein
MGDLAGLCDVLAAVSESELGGQDWSEVAAEEEAREWRHSLDAFAVWLLHNLSPHVPVEDPSVVVDVHTDTNTLQVLHAATGPLNLIAVPGEQGEHRGWVLSYFEFAEGDLGRLTDAEWRERVDQGHHREARPAWVKSYMYDP